MFSSVLFFRVFEGFAVFFFCRVFKGFQGFFFWSVFQGFPVFFFWERFRGFSSVFFLLSSLKKTFFQFAVGGIPAAAWCLPWKDSASSGIQLPPCQQSKRVGRRYVPHVAQCRFDCGRIPLPFAARNHLQRWQFRLTSHGLVVAAVRGVGAVTIPHGMRHPSLRCCRRS